MYVCMYVCVFLCGLCLCVRVGMYLCICMCVGTLASARMVGYVRAGALFATPVAV